MIKRQRGQSNDVAISDKLELWEGVSNLNIFFLAFPKINKSCDTNYNIAETGGR